MMKSIGKKNRIHCILFSIPLSVLIALEFLYPHWTFLNAGKVLLYQIPGYILTIPFFYWFVYQYFGKASIKSIAMIQLEILVHFLYVMFALLYCNSIKNYILIYNFLIFLFIYYGFKLAILISIKK